MSRLGPTFLDVIGWLGAGAAILPLLARRAYLSVPELPQSLPQTGRLPISVVVPARNERENLAALLPRLADLGVEETIVVDDASDDGTGAVAASWGARVCRIEELPEGWVGKSYACAVGARAAAAEWLLFLDADTRPEPDAARNVLAYAEARGVEVVSALLAQRLVTFWERLLIPFAYGQLFTGVAFEPTAPLLNGQLILARRATYLASLGHAAPTVRGAIAEDVALARHLARSGVRPAGVRPGVVGEVRMYRNLGEIRQGFGKNAVAFLVASPRRGMATFGATVLATLWLPLLLAAARRPALIRPLLAVLLGQVVGAAAWNQAFLGTTGPRAAAWALLQPLAAVVFQLIGSESVVRTYLGGGLRWKGRRYSGSAARGRNEHAR
jgi:hypothetical protein